MKKVNRSLKDYEDMLDLPHHASNRRPQMPIAKRAAQFAPFSAVVGHEAAIKETGRITEERKELDETEKGVINEVLKEIESKLPCLCQVEVIYFSPDKRKTGGEYKRKCGEIQKINPHTGEIQFVDKSKIIIKEIYSISGI